VSVTYDLLTRASAKADTFASLGVLANTGSQESDLAYSHLDSNYYLFSTYEVSDGVSTIGATQVFTASTPTGLFSASPFFVCPAAVNLHATTAPVDNGDGTVTFTTASSLLAPPPVPHADPGQHRLL
jgi:hypothetical protein